MGRYSNEFRERGVRLATEAMDKHDSRWAAVESISKKLGCSPQTLDKWLKQAERDTGKRAGLTTDERTRMKELEREVRELKRANEILRKASAFFAQAELDRGRK
jgi:transposase